jgi:hypothetical protein
MAAAGLLHRLSLAFAFHAVRGMYLHAERLLAKAGGSKCKERGITHSCSASEAGAKRAERSGGLHKRSAEAWGDSLRARGGGAALSKARLRHCLRNARQISGWALRAGKVRRGGSGKRASGSSAEETSSAVSSARASMALL